MPFRFLHSKILLTGGALASLLAACAGEAGEAIPTDDSDMVGDRAAASNAPDSPGSVGDEDETGAPELRVHALANIGDSISQGFDADDSEPIDLNAVRSAPKTVFKDDPTLSWIQGDGARVASVAAYYRKLDPKLELTAVSRSGAEIVGASGGTPNFERQAREIASRKAKPDLVYVLLGGNDICNRKRSTTDDATATLYGVEQVREAAARGLAALAEVLPEGATVRVVSMPRVDFLYDAAAKLAVPVKATIDSPAGPVSATVTRSCTELWTVAAAAGNGVCAIVTTESSAARRAAIGRRIDAYNEALAGEVRRLRDDRVKNPKRIVFQTDWAGSIDDGAPANSSLGTYRFTSAHVSRRDCFHPSIAGQNAIADFTLHDAKWSH